MEFLHPFIDLFIHLDDHLEQIFQQYGTLTYVIVFLIIFCETGLVFTPFLPGDSLLFAIGALCHAGGLDVKIVAALLTFAAIAGDNSNYWIGRMLAPRIFRHDNIKFFKYEYLERTKKFFNKYGVKAIILARFAPIIRTFTPFLAGMGAMRYRKFFVFDVIGGIVWVNSFVWLGYYFGNLPYVEKNFSLVILGIIVVSLIPAALEFWKHRTK